MTSLGLLYAIITVITWGLWITPSEKVELPNPQTRSFYVAVGNLFLATIALLLVGPNKLTFDLFILPFLGGVIWAVAGMCAFVALANIGMAKAIGTWAPLNILVGIAWGMILFGEFLKSGPLEILLSVTSILMIIAGILLIVFSGKSNENSKPSRKIKSGFAGAVAAGVLWGTYFIPTTYLARQNAEANDWVTAFPMAVGMFVGSTVLVLWGRKRPRCKSRTDYGLVLLTGILWSIGNFSMLLMVQEIGLGKGFTIAQLCVAVAVLIGIFYFREPAPGTKAAKWTLIGVAVATTGGVILGNLKKGIG
ncbi:MAG: GRP family sugar transporter [Verrucomicrobia bacterium]|nr:GRP family sugar transporter [Verrucomicrobiota bacterium]MDA1065569.1 GRP family sugar transporter [Verrucomicrobiota bacterium]